LEIAAVVDDDKAGETFFGKAVLPVSALTDRTYDAVVVTSYVRRTKIRQAVLSELKERLPVWTVFDTSEK